MKKSEAIAEIKKVIDAFEYHISADEFSNEFFEQERKELAERILNKCLQIGLRPPGYIADSECIGSYVEDEFRPEEDFDLGGPVRDLSSRGDSEC